MPQSGALCNASTYSTMDGGQFGTPLIDLKEFRPSTPSQTTQVSRAIPEILPIDCQLTLPLWTQLPS